MNLKRSLQRWNDESIAKERIKTIINQYFTEFKTFELRIDKLLNEHSPL